MSNNVIPKYVVPTTLHEPSSTGLANITPDSCRFPTPNVNVKVRGSNVAVCSWTFWACGSSETRSFGKQEVVNARLTHIEDSLRYRRIEFLICKVIHRIVGSILVHGQPVHGQVLAVQQDNHLVDICADCL